MIELVRYRTEDGREPFTDWFESIRDEMAKARIAIRLRQVAAGNFGDVKPIGEGVTELRIHVGAGYRIYCGASGKHVVLLLCGGDKSTQAKDIGQAKSLWAAWKRRQK